MSPQKPFRLIFYPLYPIRFILRLCRDIDGILSYITKLPFRDRYPITGTCKQRGICCHNIAVRLSAYNWNSAWTKSVIRTWYEFVYNFELIKEVPEHHILLFKCHYLKNKKCSIYFRRPYICRIYPRQGFFKPPSFLPGCGFSSVTKPTNPTPPR